MAKPDAAQVAKIPREFVQRMEFKGGNPYRARAYACAAENLSLSQVPLERLIKEERLKEEVPGIGDTIAAVVTELHHTGQHAGWKPCGAGPGKRPYAPTISRYILKKAPPTFHAALRVFSTMIGRKWGSPSNCEFDTTCDAGAGLKALPGEGCRRVQGRGIS